MSDSEWSSAIPSASWSPADAKPITAQDIREAFDKLQNEPVRICGVTQPHVIHPRSNGYTGCSMCGSVLYVEQRDGRPVLAKPPKDRA